MSSRGAQAVPSEGKGGIAAVREAAIPRLRLGMTVFPEVFQAAAKTSAHQRVAADSLCTVISRLREIETIHFDGCTASTGVAKNVSVTPPSGRFDSDGTCTCGKPR